MENAVIARLFGGGANSLSSLTGISTELQAVVAVHSYMADRSNLCRTFAFTLAEVLITLGIIGIVAAMTLPSLIQNKTNKELEVALHKNYSVIQQALQKMSTDRGETVKGGDFDTWSFYRPFQTYFNVAISCDKTKCTGMGNTDSDGNYDMYAIESYKTYNLKRSLSTNTLDDGQFMVTDGTLYLIENGNQSLTKKELFISVDVNGHRKRPNAWGHDLFTFQVMPDGKVLPMGAEGTVFDDESQYCSPTSSDGENGIGCTYKALTDKNYWKNLP